MLPLETPELVRIVVRHLVRGAPALASINWLFAREVRDAREGLRVGFSAVLALVSVTLDEVTEEKECPACPAIPELRSANYCTSCGCSLRPCRLSPDERHAWHLMHPQDWRAPASPLWREWLWPYRFRWRFQDYISFFLTPPTQCPSPVGDGDVGGSSEGHASTPVHGAWS